MGGMGGGIGGSGGGAACYRKGTKILTLRGEIPIEELSNSDMAVGPSGEKVPVRWIGWRQLSIPASEPKRDDLLPVRISRGALADNVPKRDLYVSPDHALYLEGWLIPARLLINGTTITQCDEAAEIVYYHVELAQHSVLLAEGAPAESYSECGGNRTFFANSRGVTSLRAELPETYVHRRFSRLMVPRWLSTGLVKDLLSHLGLVQPAKGLLSHLGLVRQVRATAAPVLLGGKEVEKVRHRLALRAEALPTESDIEPELRQSA